MNTSEKNTLEATDEQFSQFKNALGISGLPASAKSKPLVDRFSEWNLRLLHSFFSEASKGEEVFLRVDREFLDQIGQDIGGDTGFMEILREDLSLAGSGRSFVERVNVLIRQRKSRRLKFDYKDPGTFDPTYRNLQAPVHLPYLAALVRNDSEHPSSYYDGLKTDLKLGTVFGSNEMKRIEYAWADLQEWTEKNDGRFGFFKLRRLGGYPLIGVPRSQSILKPHDIEELSRVFVQAQIRPEQELTEKLLALVLDEARATKGIFTAGFQNALNISDFEQPIIAAFRSAFSDWDGTLPEKNNRVLSTDSSFAATNTNKINIGISLAIIQQKPLQVSPRWRLPAIQDTGEFVLFHKDIKWKGQFSGTEGANTEPSVSHVTNFWEIAELAFDDTQQFDVHYFSCHDSEPTKIQLKLQQHKLWILVPAFDDMTGDIELREGDLPGCGTAILLAPPRSVESLKKFLEREKPEYELISGIGLPEKWLFILLKKCESLTLEQRLLPDGDDGAHPKPRSIRFVGGRSIRRGYSRMYLPYDLPTIELDAPEGTRIVCPNNVSIVEKSATIHEATDEQGVFRPLRRFEIRFDNSRSASYEFKSITKDGTPLGQAKLRVAGLGGEIVDTGRPFSLDKLGRPVASNEGLTGALLGSFTSKPAKPGSLQIGFHLQTEELGGCVEQSSLVSGIPEMFLDALAQSSSLDYGTARDLLQRLIRSMAKSGEPALLLLELRRRGHIDISMTHKGHFARIHSVKPTFYSLPSTCNGRPVWALAGTLRLDHWESIARETKAWSARCVVNKSAGFKSWRLLIIDELEARSVANRIGFEYAITPSISIAEWSASLQEFRVETFRNTMESIGSGRESALRFNASKGLFTATPYGNTCELWKIPDLDTGMDNLYVLADRSKYAFVRDSRWGVWLALDAFAKWVSTEFGFDGVHPIPITYEENSGTLWLPARIGPPNILERALVLCSGNSPEVITFQEHESNGSGDRLLLSLAIGRQAELSFNRFYTDMADGKWLAYRYVPEHVARLIADKLDAVLDVI